MVSAHAKWERLGTGWGISLLSTTEWTSYPIVFAARAAGMTAYGDTAEKACAKWSTMYFMKKKAMLLTESPRRHLWEFSNAGL